MGEEEWRDSDNQLNHSSKTSKTKTTEKNQMSKRL